MRKLFKKMNIIEFFLLSLSGKGGTGKSTVAINAAVALAIRGYKVGLLDADITAPSSVKMAGMEKAKLVAEERLNPAVLKIANKTKLKQMSTAFLLPNQNIPVVWEGRGKQEAIKLSIHSINWGKLDFLCIDTPPGTSDEILSVFDNIEKSKSGVIIVTQPQGMSILDCRKAISMAQLADVPILGVIENMKSFKCPHCSKITEIFEPGKNELSVGELCIKKKIPYLGAIPIDPALCKKADEGNPFLLMNDPNFNKIIDNILVQIDRVKKQPRRKKKKRSLVMLGLRYLKTMKKKNVPTKW